MPLASKRNGGFRGRAPAENGFSVIYSLERSPLMTANSSPPS